MDITPQADTTQKPMSDDQELAKALAGVIPDAPEPVAPAPISLPTPNATVPTDNSGPTAAALPTPAVPSVQPSDVSVAPSIPQVQTLPTPTAAPMTNLDSIKKDALGELRPLIDKVDLPPEEKFDTYLMLIRSTDDSTLIAPAHTAAQSISDEKRRAEALLDIVKEIDYLSRDSQPVS